MATREQIENYMAATGLTDEVLVAEIIDEDERQEAVDRLAEKLEREVYACDNFIEFRDWFVRQVVPVLAHEIEENF